MKINTDNSFPLKKSEQEWEKQLTPEQYRILRLKGTEFPNSGKYNLHFEDGNYNCAGCGQYLFKSNQKFDSECGWPAFDDIVPGSVATFKDTSFGMIRKEVVCSNCGGHLGHVFDDGPTETGLRYCINSVSIAFEKEEQ
ncbi:MAG: peptide-methionine (R)-S-oxide reductase MsrB [Flavobacteriaceae bacterium]|nr:peptide-methionine (R)-S-oxide reductase MsrB [Flavobacteriaceae bacterium]